jgi:hypothetical protein
MGPEFLSPWFKPLVAPILGLAIRDTEEVDAETEVAETPN